jgi:hypothetical protein
MVGVGTSVILLWVPISEEPSGYTMIGSKMYAFETVYPSTAPTSNFSFHGVLFDFQALTPADCLQNPGGGDLCASVTEPHGATYWFNVSFGPPCHGLGSWNTWVSPDEHEAVEDEICTSPRLFHLLVAS